MFKKAIKVEVKHDLDKEGLMEVVEKATDNFKELLKTIGITLAIGIPCAILFGVAANLVGEAISDNITSTE